MFKNCVFKNSVDTRKWMVNASIRAVKTMAQTAVAVMGTSTVLSAIDWRMVLSSGGLWRGLSVYSLRWQGCRKHRAKEYRRKRQKNSFL